MTNRKLARARAALRTGKLGPNRLARAVALGILLGGAGALPVAVQAADSQWTGAASDEWTDDANWVVPPVNGSFVLIDVLDPNAARLRTAAAVGAVTVGDLGQGELVIEAGGQLEVLGSQPAADPGGTSLGLVIANGPGSSGNVVVDGAGASLVAEFNTVVGNGGHATLVVRNGGTAALGLDSAYAETTVGFGYYAWATPAKGPATWSSTARVRRCAMPAA
jgi:T5SS/PEP-CTERM-associated repeat protein